MRRRRRWPLESERNPVSDCQCLEIRVLFNVITPCQTRIDVTGARNDCGIKSGHSSVQRYPELVLTCAFKGQCRRLFQAIVYTETRKSKTWSLRISRIDDPAYGIKYGSDTKGFRKQTDSGQVSVSRYRSGTTRFRSFRVHLKFIAG